MGILVYIVKLKEMETYIGHYNIKRTERCILKTTKTSDPKRYSFADFEILTLREIGIEMWNLNRHWNISTKLYFNLLNLGYIRKARNYVDVLLRYIFQINFTFSSEYFHKCT